MLTARSYLLVAILLSVSLLASPLAVSAADAVASEVTPFQQSPLHKKPPLEWSVKDVEWWMSNIIGYAEYASYMRANLVDGVTLLEMEPADFESYLPIGNALHVVKIGAHVKLLKGLCKCTADGKAGEGAVSADNFWSYMKLHSARTWTWGTTVLFFPRWAMAGVYLFDKELYLDVVGTQAPTLSLEEVEEQKLSDNDLFRKSAAAGKRVVSKVKAGFYWASFLVAPDLYFAWQAARLTPRNYILMPCVVAHFLAQAFSEWSLLVTIYRGTAFKPGTPMLTKIWNVFSYTLFAPILGVVVGYVFPTVLQYITVAVIIAHSFLMILGLVILVMRDGIAAATTGPEDPKFRAAAEKAEADAAAAAAASDSTTPAAAEEGEQKSKNETID